MTESKNKCKDCKHHIASKKSKGNCWCIQSGHPHMQSINHKACDKFEKTTTH